MSTRMTPADAAAICKHLRSMIETEEPTAGGRELMQRVDDHLSAYIKAELAGVIDDGGPVNPCTEAHGMNSGWSGTSLRDNFAGLALSGLLSDVPKSMYGLDWKQTLSRESYELADAMLVARKVRS